MTAEHNTARSAARRPARQGGQARKAPRGTPGQQRQARNAPRRAPRAPKPRAQTAEVPPQGYETDEEASTGKAIEPPTTVEIAASLAELAIEGAADAARAGMSAGTELLRGAAKLLEKR
jgi:hypothetical protein